MSSRSPRTVRLDAATEAALDEVRQATGMSVSEVLKRGVLTLREAARATYGARPYEVYATLDLGPGGYAEATRQEGKAGFRAALRRKHGR
jgi:hypothetical protein